MKKERSEKSFIRNMIFKKKFQITPKMFGYIEDPPDPRDLWLSKVQLPVPLIDLPERYILKQTILNQEQKPHCVGYTGAVLKEEKEWREKKQIVFDGDWLYKECKKIDGMPNIDGTSIRALMKVLKNTGAKPLNSAEPPEKYKIGAYAQLDDLTYEGLRMAIFRNGVIAAGFLLSIEGWRTAYIRPPRYREKVYGHAVSLIGWDKDYIILQNSWAEKWGDEGLGYFNPKNYPPWHAWACLVDLPTDLIILKPKFNFTKDLKLGDKNEDVVMLQKCLKYLNFFPQIINANGHFGMITFRAVQTFQATYKIPQTGFVGSLTRAKLNEIFA